MAVATERYDLCVLGAGIAGLNAVFVASGYLSAGQRIILVDRNPRCGGMWNNTYGYVRLHQPYRLFTVGDIPWKLRRDASYLATRDEVLDHFADCVQRLGELVQLDELYGHDYLSHEEPADGPVRIECRPVDGGETVTIEADRLIKAFGNQIDVNQPLTLTSSAVRSVSPDSFDLTGDEIRASEAPIYVVGGGKTAMDTAALLASELPDRELSLIVGSGTMFAQREILFPRGARRWWGGRSPLRGMLDVARRFDGTNEDEVWDYFRTHYTTALTPDCRMHMYGILSEQERDLVTAGASEIVRDYFVDVVDGADGRPQINFRSGESRGIEPGSWIVNCTGYFMRRPREYEPYLSPGGRVLSTAR